MKYILIFAFLVFNLFTLAAQQKRFAVDWSENVNVSTIERPLLVPGFEEEFFSYSPVTGIRYSNRWKAQEFIDLNSVRLQDVVYENVNAQMLLSLKTELIPDALNLTVSNSSARNTDFFEFSFAPIIRSDGVVKRVTSFTNFI